MSLQFEWNEAKNRSNLRKHGISFELASEVFEDPLCLVFMDQYIDGKDRWLAYGRVEGELLSVAHTVYAATAQSEVLRLISARRATSKERRIYEGRNG